MTFLIHQLVRMIFLIRPLVRTNFAIRQLVRMIFLIRQLVRIDPVICLESFSQLLDEVHTTFSDERLVSITKPQERFLRQVCLNSLLTQATYTQDRLRHVHHKEIIPFPSDRQFSTRSVAFRIPGAVFRWHL